MPLSEQEQRLLDEMERNLYSSDADVVSAGGRVRRPNLRAIVFGALVAVLGIVGLIGGVISHLMVVGIIGFAVLFGGVVLALTPARDAGKVSRSGRTKATRTGKSSSDLMGRLGDRWDKRAGA